MPKFIISLLSIFCLLPIRAEIPFVEPGYFRSPVDYKIYLSGTFGEPRTTHFHTGLDIKTMGVEGKNIYAVADGYISRIGVSAYGYGNALYITHPNGLVSVYGHLQKFNSKIEAWVKTQQRAQTNFEISMENLDSSFFPVKKGDVIALSGNSGGSGGPHLHFEIRDSFEHPLNPLLFGFKDWVEDVAKPTISSLFIYNRSEDAPFSDSKNMAVVSAGLGAYKLNSTLFVDKNEIGFGVQCVDLFTGTSNQNGVYQIKLYDDGVLCYHYQVDELNFDYGKHVYSHCDYWAKRGSNKTVHKCYVEKGNKLHVYSYLVNQGKIYVGDGKLHEIKIEVSDFHGNTANLVFKVQKQANVAFFPVKELNYQELFVCGQRNLFRNDNISLEFPSDVFFEDTYFEFEEKTKSAYSKAYRVHNAKTPIANYFDISIKVEKIDTNLRDKYLLVFTDYKNAKKAIGGKIREGFIHARTRELGTYFIDLDTIAPKITAVNISENKSMSTQKNIQFKASDNLSGIAEYNAFINGTWVVLEYDAKKALFTYFIDDAVVKGSNTIEVIVADERANASKVKFNFIY